MCMFSVIIPVYNEEKYISRCLHSLIAQTMIDYEVIIVDDGSGDYSIDICKKFQSKFQYCSIITHTKNMGASAARNIGIKYATGSYIVFLDADDTLSPCFFEILSQQIKKYKYPDILEFLMIYIEKNGYRSIQGTILNEGIYDRKFIEDIFIPVHLECVRKDEYMYTLFNALRVIRRYLINENHIMFNVNIKRWEDWSFAIQVFLCANNMVVVKMPLYNYFENNAGNRVNYQPETFSYVIQSYKEIDQVVGDRYDTFSDYAVERKIAQFEDCISEILFHECSDEKRKKYIYNILHNDYFQKVLSFSGKDTKWYFIWNMLKKTCMNIFMNIY